MQAASNDFGAIIVPAFNEERHLPSLLTGLTRNGVLPNTPILVVCNGCSDASYFVARQTAQALAGRVPHKISVLELAHGSKVGAIRAAEELLLPGARLYLDGDVACDGATAVQLLEAVGAAPAGVKEVMAADVAVPTRRLDMSGVRSLVLRSYHQFWADLPWVKSALAGRGAYAMSQSLRGSFGQFPDLVADDRWATTRVGPERSRIVPGVVSIRPAESFKELLAARRRVFVGNRNPQVPQHDVGRADRLAGLVKSAARPSRWLGLATFVVVGVLAKRAARQDVAAGKVQWSTAHSRTHLSSSTSGS